MERGWKTPDRRALLEQMAADYQQASAPQKKEILAQFVAKTGYVRKYAVWVLVPPGYLYVSWLPTVS